MAKKKPSVEDIVELKYELETLYAPWKAQMVEAEKFYEGNYKVASTLPPNDFEEVRPPSAKTIIDLTADHAAGNFPRLHVPRRKETDQAQKQTTVMEKAAQGFWYRNLANSPRNILRAWAQSGAMRGAIGASLVCNLDVLADLPLPSEHGGIDSEDYKAAKEEAIALRKSAWPFVLDYVDPLHMLPDPASEGKDFIIVAFKRKVYDVVRAWPQWDRKVPGDVEPRKLTDEVDFIHYANDTYRSYIVASDVAKKGKALNSAGGGVVKHGYGFNPLFFTSGGFGSPFGGPEQKYKDLLTPALDLLKLEARRMTHLDAIIAQQAFPWIVMQHGVTPDMGLGGVTRVPPGTKPSDAIMELRPQIPIQELVTELGMTRAALQRATIPDSLGAEPNKSEESGYLRSLKIGTGRARIRALSNGLERACEWATTGFYKLVENKIQGPVSVWGKGMDSAQEFVTIDPDDIKGHYEVYVSLVPNLPNDESVDIANGLKLHSIGAIPVRDVLETYAGRENADELMTERLGEDVLRSAPMFGQLVNDAMQVTGVVGGPLGTPGFTSGIQSGLPAQPVGMTAAANPQSMAGVGAARSIPTPPASPGSLAESNSVIGQTSRGGAPQGGPLAGIQRGKG